MRNSERIGVQPRALALTSYPQHSIWRGLEGTFFFFFKNVSFPIWGPLVTLILETYRVLTVLGLTVLLLGGLKLLLFLFP